LSEKASRATTSHWSCSSQEREPRLARAKQKIRREPIAAALGAMGGAALGGLVGSFTGLGIPSEEAEQFDQAVRAGRIVLAVRILDRSAEERALAIIQPYQPHSVGSYSQSP